MRSFTAAAEIAENVYLGNSFDVPVALEDAPSAEAAQNKKGFSVCIESREGAHMLAHRDLKDAEMRLDAMGRQAAQRRKKAKRQHPKSGAGSTVAGSGTAFWYSSSSDEASLEGSETDSPASSSAGEEEEEEDFADFEDAYEGRERHFAAGHNCQTPIKLRYKRASKSLRAARLEHQRKKAASLLGLPASVDDGGKGRELAVPSDNNDIVHLECAASGQNVRHESHRRQLVDAILDHVVWVRAVARPHLRTSIDYRRQTAAHVAGNYPHQQQHYAQIPPARRVLLHCMDGYTDTSLLALAYTMYDRVLSLPEAYLYLQNTKERSFFVYPADVQLLSALERRIAEIVGRQGRARFNDDLNKEELEAALATLEAEKDKAKVEQSSRLAAAQQQSQQQGAAGATNGGGFGSALGAAARSYLQPIRPSLFSRSSSHSSTATLRASIPSSSTNARQHPPLGPVSDAFSHPWFYTDLFDGHFPSRILPFLYLGNINHANNALMLRALGITHVLSVGESALVPPHKLGAPPAGSAPPSPGKARLPTNSLWLEQSMGNIEVCDIQDIQDDGCDPILNHMCTALEFIERARQRGGRVLVHCRVGVSRSATLVIAYVMKYFDMSLPEAYLLVRARRLNILIQPTLLFMHCLHTWEEAIRESGINEEGNMAVERSGRITWPVLSLELANLNKKCKLHACRSANVRD